MLIRKLSEIAIFDFKINKLKIDRKIKLNYDEKRLPLLGRWNPKRIHDNINKYEGKEYPW